MKKELACLVIHGIGRQKPDFADGLVAGVSAQLDTLGHDPEVVAWQSVYWDDILRPAQDTYLKAAYQGADLNARGIRTLLLHALGDAAGYRQLPSGRSRGGEETTSYRRIHERVRDAVRSLYREPLSSRPVPLVVVAHSFAGTLFRTTSGIASAGQTSACRLLSA